MRFSFWSDEDRWFVPRAFGLGYSLNFKYVAKRLGWIKPRPEPAAADAANDDVQSVVVPKTREDQLRERIEASKREDVR